MSDIEVKENAEQSPSKDDEHEAYLKAASNAFDDSIRAYENMDKWMLSLSGGAFALSAALASNSNTLNWLFYIGLCCFAFSTCMLVHSKYKSYLMCESSVKEIESIYKTWPHVFTRQYHEIEAASANRFNMTNENKNFIGLWSFILGIVFVLLSLMPLDINQLCQGV